MGRGLLVGRFQPFHRGHLAVATAIRAARPASPLLLAVGSAQASYTFENPFTAGERIEMIDRALSAAQVTGCVPLPVIDIDRHALWVAHLESTLPPFDRVYTNNPLTRLLFERAGYAVEAPALVNRRDLEGVRIRRLLATGGRWAARVPPAVAAYLKEIDAERRLARLRERPSPRRG